MPRAVRAAVELAGLDLGSVRIDSGDLPVVAHQVRALLDELGAKNTRIVLTGDLDEYSIAALATAPVDGYGVGTSLVTGSGAPTAALVYKLVARSDRPAAGTVAGRCGRWPSGRWASRGWADASGPCGTTTSAAWRGRRRSSCPARTRDRATAQLLVPLVRAGEIVGREPLQAARERHRQALAELPPQARQLSRGDPAIPTVFENGDERD